VQNGVIDSPRHPTIEKIESNLIASSVAQVGSGMPRIYRRRPGDSLLIAREVLNHIGELLVRGHPSDIEFVHRVKPRQLRLS
jgi:hypothetical protein